MLVNEIPLSASPAEQGQQHLVSSTQRRPRQSPPEVHVTLDLTVTVAANKEIFALYLPYLLLILASAACCTAGFMLVLDKVQLWLWFKTEGAITLTLAEAEAGNRTSLPTSRALSEWWVPPASQSLAAPLWATYAPFAPCTTFQAHGCEFMGVLRPILTEAVFSLLSVIPLVYLRLLETEMADLLANDTWTCWYPDEHVHVRVERIKARDDSNETSALKMALTSNFALSCTVGPLAPMVNLTTATLADVNEDDVGVWPAGAWPSFASSQSGNSGYRGDASLSANVIFSQAEEITEAYNTSYRSCEELVLAACSMNSSVEAGLDLEYLMLPNEQGDGHIIWCGGDRDKVSQLGSSSGSEHLRRRVTVCQVAHYEQNNIQPIAVTASEGPSVPFDVLTEVWTAYKEYMEYMQIVGASQQGRVAVDGEVILSEPAVMFMTAELCSAVVLILLALVGFTLPVHRFQLQRMRTALELDVSVKIEDFVRGQEQRRAHRRARREEAEQAQEMRNIITAAATDPSQPQCRPLSTPALSSFSRGGLADDTGIHADDADPSVIYGTARYLPRESGVAGLLPSAPTDTVVTPSPSSTQDTQRPYGAATADVTVATRLTTDELLVEPNSSPVPPVFATAANGPSRGPVSSREAQRGGEVSDLFTVPVDEASTPSPSSDEDADHGSVNSVEINGNNSAESHPLNLAMQQHQQRDAATADIPGGQQGGAGVERLRGEACSHVTFSSAAAPASLAPRSTVQQDSVVFRTQTPNSQAAPSRAGRPFSIQQQQPPERGDRGGGHFVSSDEPVNDAVERTPQPASVFATGDAQATSSATVPRQRRAGVEWEEGAAATSYEYVDEYSDSEGEEYGQQSVIPTGSTTVVLTTITTRPPSKKGTRLRIRRAPARFTDHPRNIDQIIADARQILQDYRKRQLRTMHIFISVMLLLNFAAFVLLAASFSFVLVAYPNDLRLLAGSEVSSVEEGRDDVVWNGSTRREYRSYYEYHAERRFTVLVALGFSILALAHVVLSLVRLWNVF